MRAIYNILELSDDYTITDSKDVFYSKRDIFKKNVINNIKNIIPIQEIAKKIFYNMKYKCNTDEIDKIYLSIENLFNKNIYKSSKKKLNLLLKKYS